MQFYKTLLPNGLRVLTIPMPSFESATVLLMVGAGSRYETAKNNGISHFLEHMAFKGTKKRPSAMAISSIIDGIGGEFNAFTGKESTGYYIKSFSKHINLSMDVLSDMLRNSLLSSKEIEKEKGVILEEINLYEDTPVRKIGDIYEQLLYDNTPMGWDIAGRKNVIKKIQRKDFVDYMSDLYSAHNMTLVVAGGVSHKKVIKLADEYFGKMKKFKTKSFIKIDPKQEEPRVLIRHKKTEQAHIALGVPTVPLEHSDQYPLAMLTSILGGGMSSRLFHEVREKRGLAYYVRTQPEHYQDSGNLVTLAGVDAKRIKDAIEVIVNEYARIAGRKPGITKEEFKKAREFIKGHFVLELEDSRSVAVFYASQELLEGKIDNPEEVIAKLDKITIEDVENAARKYLNARNLNLAVIGDFEDGQKFKKLLRL